MNRRTFILILVLLLAVLLKLSFWADQRSVEVQGPTQIVRGPQDTLYFLTDDQIIKTSSEGETLSVLELDAMGVQGPVADLFVEPDGQLLIGLMDFQDIHRYSPEGRFLGALRRPSSEPKMGVPGQHERNFKFTRDPRSGMLYVADSNHHRIQIFRSDGSEIKTLTSPSGFVQSDDGSHAESDVHASSASDANRPFLFPNALAVDGERLFATDTDNHRIVVFSLEGALDRIIPTVRDHRTPFTFPVHFSRAGSTLFVINRGPLFRGGEVIALDLDRGERRRLYPEGLPVDPLDVLARENDVLIADGETRNVLRYTPEGGYYGFFGRPSLQALLAPKGEGYRTYRFLRVLSLGGMMIVLLAFLTLKRVERKERESLGLPSEHQPLAALRNFLGPEGSVRRVLLLTLLPGLGQIAAGRILRAVLLLPVLLLLVILFIGSMVVLLLEGVTVLPAMLFVGIVTAAVWTGIVLDGLRLNEETERPKSGFNLLRLLIIIGIPFITVLSGALAQLIWEIVNHQVPELSLAMQRFIGDVMLACHLESEQTVAFAAMTPVGRFLGWGGAIAGVFGAFAWRSRAGWTRVALAAAVGFIIGMLSWLFSATFPGSLLGGAYYLPLSQGLLVSFSVYLYFRRTLVTALIIPAGVAAAWIGNLVHLFGRFTLPFLTLPGASIRISSVVYETYCIHLAILIVIMAHERKMQLVAPSEGGS